jgi:hypothetical protein
MTTYALTIAKPRDLDRWAECEAATYRRRDGDPYPEATDPMSQDMRRRAWRQEQVLAALSSEWAGPQEIQRRMHDSSARLWVVNKAMQTLVSRGLAERRVVSGVMLPRHEYRRRP